MMRATYDHRKAIRSLLLIGVGWLMLQGGSAAAQRTTIEGRVDRLEQEMRAVQRKVFPGGAGQIVSPEISPTPAAPGIAAGAPAASPIADLTARVTAIEAQLARLTGQVEEGGHRLRQLEDAFARFSAPPPTPVAATSPAPAATAPVTPRATAPSQPSPARKAPPAPAGAAAAARAEQVALIERPSTGNAASDSYGYGYRLWQAKFYPEAQAQLQATVDKFGKDPIASRAQNLLGRAYLDDGKPSVAAKLLYENYRERPKGDRAAESLAWVGEALIQLNRTKDACLAYDELTEVFGASMPGNVRDMVAKGRVRAKCGG